MNLTKTKKIGIGIIGLILISTPIIILLNQDENEPSLSKMEIRIFNSVSLQQIKENISIEIYSFELYNFGESDEILFSEIEPTFVLQTILYENFTYMYNQSLYDDYICQINTTNHFPSWHLLWGDTNTIYLNKNITDVAMNITEIPTNHTEYTEAKAVKFMINDSDSCIPKYNDFEHNTDLRPYLILNFVNTTRPGDFDFNYIFYNNLFDNYLVEGYCYSKNQIILMLNTINPNSELWFRYSENNCLKNISLCFGTHCFEEFDYEIAFQEIYT